MARAPDREGVVSLAADRKAMREILPAYALMSVPEVGRFLGVGEDVAREMIDAGVIPSVKVGKRRHVDPIDLAVYVLAERAAMTADAFWAEHGEQAVDLAKRYVARIRRWVA